MTEPGGELTTQDHVEASTTAAAEIPTQDHVEASTTAAAGISVPAAERYEIAGYHQETPLTVHEPRGVKRTAAEANAAAASLAKKKRLCRYPGCVRVIKSQGHCQRHGARAKRCKVEGCEKQAQGTHEGMCKRHWKLKNFPEEATKKGSTPPEPEGESVYDTILPMSIAYRPIQRPNMEDPNDPQSQQKYDQYDPPSAPESFQVMPLLHHLKEGFKEGKPVGWHRNEERRARGMFPVKGLSVQLEPWERQLALLEIVLLSGGTPFANFKELAFAWGREKGFHHVLANAVCERRGEVERKKRSDAGRSMTEEEKLAFRSKLQKSKKKGKKGDQETANEEEGQTLVHQHPPVAVVGGGEHAKAAEPIVAVDGGPGVEETVVPTQVPMEAAGGLPESVGIAEAPAPIHVAPAAESTAAVEAEQQVAGEAHRSVTEI